MKSNQTTGAKGAELTLDVSDVRERIAASVGHRQGELVVSVERSKGSPNNGAQQTTEGPTLVIGGKGDVVDDDTDSGADIQIALRRPHALLALIAGLQQLATDPAVIEMLNDTADAE